MNCPICNGMSTLKFSKDNEVIATCLECGTVCKIKKINDKDLQNKKVHNQAIKRIESLDLKNNIPILICNIKKYRTEQGLSQEEVCKAIDIATQRYGNIERCKNIPTPVSLLPISIILNASFSELYTNKSVSSKEYNILKYLSVNENEEIIYNELLEMKDKEIIDYQKKNNIFDTRVFDNKNKKDSKEIAESKKKFQAMVADYKDMRKKLNAILQQDTIIEYYFWEKAKEFINKQGDPDDK